MVEYLDYQFQDTPEFINTFDELPLWSASFGLLLFKHLELKPNITVLDIGSGAGFPLMELAARLGNSCICYGLDPWVHANQRAQQKIINYQLTNVKLISASAEKIPLADSSIDLIVSNLGINNFEHPDLVFTECHRVLKSKGRIVLTTNISGHWKEFYDLFEQILIEKNLHSIIPELHQHIEHRGNLDSISSMFTNNGFSITRHFEESIEMHFLNGSAFLNHYFIKLGWLDSWRQLIPEPERITFFTALELLLNEYSKLNNGLKLTVPMLYIEGIKKE